MNLLVVGGLFIIGILALVSLVFVIRSETAAQKSVNMPPPVPTEQEEPEIDTIADQPSPAGEVPSTADEETTLVGNHAVDEWQPLVNGQLYELKNELRSLHGQAQGLEQRLKTIVDMVERIEQAQNGRFPIEGQPSDTITPAARQVASQ